MSRLDRRFVRKPMLERLWAKIDQRSEEECWPWLRPLNTYGYGVFATGRARIMAHRVVYELLVGPIPDGLTLDHLCRNRACVNPRHVEPVTLAENVRRGDSSANNGNKLLTHCKRGHPFSPENTRHRDGRRICRICKRETNRESWRRRFGKGGWA